MTALDQLTDRIALILDPDALDPVEQETALAVADAVLGMLKPLEWVNQPSTCSRFEAGEYVIVDYGYYGQGFSLFLHGNGQFPEFDTLEDAKAAANAHHRAQILAALGIKQETEE